VSDEPAFGDRTVEAGPELARTAAAFRNGALTSSVKMRPSCTGPIVLAISTSLRAATSGSAKGRGSANFMQLCLFGPQGNRFAGDRRYRPRWLVAH
jgi:hypothetical protein